MYNHLVNKFEIYMAKGMENTEVRFAKRPGSAEDQARVLAKEVLAEREITTQTNSQPERLTVMSNRVPNLTDRNREPEIVQKKQSRSKTFLSEAGALAGALFGAAFDTTMIVMLAGAMGAAFGGAVAVNPVSALVIVAFFIGHFGYNYLRKND